MDIDSNTSNVSNSSGACSDASWLAYPITFLVLYWVGITTCAAVYLAGLLLAWKNWLHSLLATLRRLKQVSRKLVSGDNAISKMLILTMLFCNLMYMVLAFQRAYEPQTRCFSSLSEVPDLAVELAISPPLIIFFFIRLLASDNLLLFWVKAHNIVDVVTLPHAFIALALGQDWLDIKSLRFVWLTQITDVLRFLPFIHSQDTIDVVSLVVRLVALWLSATGLIHVLESTGDPWRDFSNEQHVTFLEYAYFTIVTMSTVGYGDYFAMTDTGKAFMTVFIIAGISFFAFALPTLIELIIDYYHRTQWSRFDTTRVPRHVLVCGHITATTVSDFLKDFLHKDRADNKTHVLFMHTERPDADLRTVLRSYYTRVQYVSGSVLRSEDLAKAKIKECIAVFILAEKHSDCPEREDRENLLRLVSVKNTVPDITVIIQVLLSSSKAQVTNIPHTGKDTVICLSELKLGLLAQSCLCPGLSTLIGNLFYTSEDMSDSTGGWQGLYGQSISHEVYLTQFSQTFEGMTFYEAAQLCYDELGLILLAVEDMRSGQLYISPSPNAHHSLCIQASNPSQPDKPMLGYFIGEDQIDVNRVSWHGESQQDKIRTTIGMPLLSLYDRDSPPGRRKPSMPVSSPDVLSSSSLRARIGDLHMITTFPDMEECVLTHNSPPLTNHVLLCVFSDDSSSVLYLHNFLEPLRRKTIAHDELMPVVIVSSRKFLEKEWPHISCFPSVFLLPGCPLDWDTLSLAHVESCQKCVILTASMKGEVKDAAMRDKEAILCSLMIHNHFKQASTVVSAPPLIITDLIEESNVQFLDIEDEDSDDGQIFISQPFACGEAFAASFFDSITSSIFHSPGTLFLVEQLISASLSEFCSTHSHIFSLPLSKVPSHNSLQTFGQLYSSMLSQHKTCLAISRLLVQPSEGQNVCTVLPLMTSGHLAMTASQRYIVTAPPPNTVLYPSDHILILEEQVI